MHTNNRLALTHSVARVFRCWTAKRSSASAPASSAASFALRLPEQAHPRQMIVVCHDVACLTGRALAHLSPRVIP
jgi:hypothetical protein